MIEDHEEEQDDHLEDKPRHFTITYGDISLLQLRDGAIVNPSNTGLILGSGVSEAIARRAGPDFQQKLHTTRSRLPGNRLDPGRAIDTESGGLSSKRLIHVSIVGKKKVDKRLITNSIINVYDLAEEIGITQIAFPALGVGLGKFPVEQFVELFFQITCEELPRSETLEHVILCLFDEAEFEVARAYAEAHQDEVPPSITMEVKASSGWTGFS